MRQKRRLLCVRPYSWPVAARRAVRSVSLVNWGIRIGEVANCGRLHGGRPFDCRDGDSRAPATEHGHFHQEQLQEQSIDGGKRVLGSNLVGKSHPVKRILHFLQASANRTADCRALRGIRSLFLAFSAKLVLQPVLAKLCVRHRQNLAAVNYRLAAACLVPRRSG
jgi:hypothetical protein